MRDETLVMFQFGGGCYTPVQARDDHDGQRRQTPKLLLQGKAESLGVERNRRVYVVHNVSDLGHGHTSAVN